MTHDSQLAATVAAAQQQTAALKRTHYGDQRAAALIASLTR